MAQLTPGVYVREVDQSFLPQKEDLIKGAWQAYWKNDQEKLEYIYGCDRVFTKPLELQSDEVRDEVREKVEDYVDGEIAKSRKDSMATVARVFPELIAEQLVGVQPMAAPDGLAYVARYRYKSEPCPPNAISEAWKDFCAGRSTKFWSGQDRDNVKRYRTAFDRDDFNTPE